MRGKKEGSEEIKSLGSAKKAISKHIAVERKEHKMGGRKGKRKGRRGAGRY
jgi:hypothetical protein